MPKYPYERSPEKLFDVANDGYSRERVRVLKDVYLETKRECPDVSIAFALYGSLAKGKRLTAESAPHSDVDMVIIYDSQHVTDNASVVRDNLLNHDPFFTQDYMQRMRDVFTRERLFRLKAELIEKKLQTADPAKLAAIEQKLQQWVKDGEFGPKAVPCQRRYLIAKERSILLPEEEQEIEQQTKTEIDTDLPRLLGDPDFYSSYDEFGTCTRDAYEKYIIDKLHSEVRENAVACGFSPESEAMSINVCAFDAKRTREAAFHYYEIISGKVEADDYWEMDPEHEAFVKAACCFAPAIGGPDLRKFQRSLLEAIAAIHPEEIQGIWQALRNVANQYSGIGESQKLQQKFDQCFPVDFEEVLRRLK